MGGVKVLIHATIDLPTFDPTSLVKGSDTR